MIKLSSRAHDLTGKTFGDLTVVDFAGRVGKRNQVAWNCICSCGNSREVIGAWLTNGLASHCGCKTHRAESVAVGDRFGRLRVLSPSAKRRCYWKVRCECGREFDAYQSNLRSGKSTACRSCGHPRLGIGVSTANRLFGEYERSAKVRALKFQLSRGEFDRLISGSCHYCGSKPASLRKHGRANETLTYNGIDRVDNSVGYVESNCVSCCYLCNHMKWKLSSTYFLAHVKRIVENSITAPISLTAKS